MKTRTETINELIKENGFTSYLEIGLGNLANFKAIQCETKVGVDPAVKGKDIATMTSDEYFLHNQDSFGLVFIDGDHTKEQLELDICNAWNALEKGGMILIHDILPPSKESTIVPRQQTQWVGSCFKTWYGFKEKYTKIKVDYIPEMYGLGVIYKSRHKVEPGFISDISFEDYMEMKGWE